MELHHLARGARSAAGLALLAALSPAGAAAPAPLFEERTPLAIELELDLRSLLDERDETEAEWQEGRLGYVDADGTPQSLSVGVRARGRYRLREARCRIPPLWLSFEGRAVEGTIFEGQVRTPLGTHCRESGRYTDYVVLEYLAYRGYELVGPPAVRVRPASITYVDAGSRGEKVTRFGFFIENFAEMARRNDAEVIEQQPFDPRDGDAAATVVMEIYQYLIGNTDWSQAYQHNIVLLRRRSDSVVVPVPFDFDWSGLVDARYARPDPRLGIRSVRQRLYRGVCWPAEQWPAAFQRFEERRAALYALIREQPELSDGARRRSLDYLDDFYEVLDSPERRQRDIIDDCR